MGIYKDVRDNADGDRGARQGVRPTAEDASQVRGRVRMQVLPATIHQTVQPYDTRAQPQGRRDLHLRGLRQVVQAAGQPQAAQMWVAVRRGSISDYLLHPLTQHTQQQQ